MAFDMGFNFRSTLGYVTDQAYAVAALDQTYPYTFTNANGYSLNAGYSGGGDANFQDKASGNDPRIAGNNYRQNLGSPSVWTFDLSSGSAPGAGVYTIDLAFGDPTAARRASFLLKDNTTTLIDGTNGGTGFATAAGHFIDATLADVAATTTWTGATTSKTFATTTVKLEFGVNSVAEYSLLAHFRLTLVPPAAIVIPRLLMPPMRAA